METRACLLHAEINLRVNDDWGSRRNDGMKLKQGLV